METTAKYQVNQSAIAALAFSVFCWAALYAVYADFAQSGIELLGRPGFLPSAEGVLLITLHTIGQLLLGVFALGLAIALARLVRHSAAHEQRISGNPR
jgi:hypothetical protein